MKRVITALILVPLVLVLIFLPAQWQWLFSLTVAGVAALAGWEYLNLTRRCGANPPRVATLIALLALFALCERSRLRFRGLALAVVTLLLAAAAQIALNAYLLHQPSLNGERPPYLLARVIADGPGKLYLDQHCATEHWTVCASLAQLGNDPDAFLWDADGVYESRSEQEQAQIRQEEMPLVKAIVRAYPRQQGERSWANFHDQLLAFGIYGFDNSPWLQAQFDTTLRPARSAWLRSRQANNQLPLDALTALQGWSVTISLGVIVLLAVLFRLHLGVRLAALTGAVFALVVANAALTGVLSMVDDRYGCRVIWMIPLVAGLCLMEALGRLRAVRKDIARIYTVMRERELGIISVEDGAA